MNEKKKKQTKKRVEILNCPTNFVIPGKILDDDKPVSFYKIEEKNFVVVMVTKVCSK